jgi:thioredoxin reductase
MQPSQSPFSPVQKTGSGRGSRPADGKRPRLAILGAGPVGIEAALYAAALHFPFRLYERGRVGEHLHQWGHVKLFTPFGMNATPLGKAALLAESPHSEFPADADLLTGKDHLAAYIEPLAGLPALREHVEPGTSVLHVGRKGCRKEDGPAAPPHLATSKSPHRAGQPFVLLLRNASGAERVEEADAVLDCTGVYGNPRRLGDGGVPAVGEAAARPHIAWGIEDVLGGRRAHYADRNVLVVGAGHSAATTVCQLAALAAQAPSTWVVWLARRPGSQPLRRATNDPLRERDLLCGRANTLATRGEGHVEFYAQAVVTRIETQGKDAFTAHALVAGEPRSWQVDRIIANVGGEPDNQPYRELHVAECFITGGPAGVAAALREQTSPAAEALRTPEPGFFILGSKSYGRHPGFLMRNGFEQVRGAFALLAGQSDLDLYRKAR